MQAVHVLFTKDAYTADEWKFYDTLYDLKPDQLEYLKSKYTTRVNARESTCGFRIIEVNIVPGGELSVKELAAWQVTPKKRVEINTAAKTMTKKKIATMTFDELLAGGALVAAAGNDVAQGGF